MGDADRLDVPTEYRERPPSDLPTEWTSWVDVNLGRNPKCGASLLVTLLERGFHPLPSIQAVGDISLSLEAGDHTIKTVEICVLIASYRDPDCAPTLADLFAQAAHPERIRVAVVSQEEKGDRLKTSLIPKAHHAQIGIRRVKSTSSQGVCWARHLGQQMVGQEPFILQLDSHMRFEPGWDLLLLATWIHCQDSRAVLTAYPAGHTPGGTRESGVFYGMAAKQFNQDGVLLFTGCPRFVDGGTVPIRPLPGAFVSANFLFAPAESVRQVPYDPSLYFFGEEVSYAARLWTHGFNLYHPNRAILYHDWDRARRATHFEDHRDWTNRDRISKARVRALLGVLGEDGSPPSAMDLGGYVLGEQRSLADYERWSGVSFSTRQIAKPATECVFPAVVATAYHVNARQVLAGQGFVVVDDFLPNEQYELLREFLVCHDYKHINSQGPIARAWHLQDRFPLRSVTSWIKKTAEQGGSKPDWVYPTGLPIDGFMQAIESYQAQHVPWVGERGGVWDEFSATSWIYQPGTSLAMHTDGVNVYSGAYVYFLNDTWRSHWGGLLVVMNASVNNHVAEIERSEDGSRWYRRRWLHENPLEELLLEGGGLGQVIFPKANRVVFLANDVYHMVTRVNEEAGDCVRLSLAGFFNVRR